MTDLKLISSETNEVSKPNPISFQALWEKAEEVSKKTTSSREELFIKIKLIFDEYMKLDNIPSQEIQKILKKKKFGELLFSFAELSRLDNINVYAVLNTEVQITDNFSPPK